MRYPAGQGIGCTWPRKAQRRQGRGGGILRGFALAGIVAGLPLVALLGYHSLVHRGVWGGQSDLIGRDAGYETLAAATLAEADRAGAGWIGTTDYRTYAALRWQLREALPVVQLNERSRFIDFAVPEIGARTGLYVYVADERNAAIPLAEPREIIRVWRGQPMATYGVEVVSGWTPELSPPADSPLYAWPDLV